jgi:DNA-binding response OmpR family regulator
MCETFQPDLILLDVRMPYMNGDEMLEHVRSTEWGSRPRVIILTNISKDEAPMKLRFLNVDRYIVKAHYTPQQVVDVVREVLDEKIAKG